MKVLEDSVLVKEDLLFDEENTAGDIAATSDISSISLKEDDEKMYEERQESNTRIPLKKIKIVNMVKEHPNWSLKTIQHQGDGALRTKKDLPRWKNIKNGGTTLEKYEQINNYNRYEDATEEKRPVTTRILQTWAAQAAAQYQSDKFRFKASKSWVKNSKPSTVLGVEK